MVVDKDHLVECLLLLVTLKATSKHFGLPAASRGYTRTCYERSDAETLKKGTLRYDIVPALCKDMDTAFNNKVAHR